MKFSLLVLVNDNNPNSLKTHLIYTAYYSFSQNVDFLYLLFYAFYILLKLLAAHSQLLTTLSTLF